MVVEMEIEILDGSEILVWWGLSQNSISFWFQSTFEDFELKLKVD